MLETDSAVFVEDIIKRTMNEYPDLDKQMEGSGFSFKFVSSLCISCHKVNVTKVSSYIESLKWLRYRNAKTNLKYIDDGCYCMLLCSNKTMKK